MLADRERIVCIGDGTAEKTGPNFFMMCGAIDSAGCWSGCSRGGGALGCAVDRRRKVGGGWLVHRVGARRGAEESSLQSRALPMHRRGRGWLRGPLHSVADCRLSLARPTRQNPTRQPDQRAASSTATSNSNRATCYEPPRKPTTARCLARRSSASAETQRNLPSSRNNQAAATKGYGLQFKLSVT